MSLSHEIFAPNDMHIFVRKRESIRFVPLILYDGEHMPTLSDGTPIKIQDDTYDRSEAFEDAFDDNDQEVLLKI